MVSFSSTGSSPLCCPSNIVSIQTLENCYHKLLCICCICSYAHTQSYISSLHWFDSKCTLLTTLNPPLYKPAPFPLAVYTCTASVGVKALTSAVHLVRSSTGFKVRRLGEQPMTKCSFSFFLGESCGTAR